MAKRNEKPLASGLKVQVNQRHAGLCGSTGRTTGRTAVFRGWLYNQVRFTGGRARGDAHWMRASELDILGENAQPKRQRNGQPLRLRCRGCLHCIEETARKGYCLKHRKEVLLDKATTRKLGLQCWA